VLALGLNLSQFNELLKTESVGKNNIRLLLLDNNGTKISDSQPTIIEQDSFNDLQSFKNAKNGKLGSIVENVDGKNMTISYAPLNFAQTKWILLSIATKS
jgi:hypothetical protein